MSQYDFTYEVPENLHNAVVRFLQLNGHPELAQKLQMCSLEYEDVGLAHYAGLKGETWDKKALDFTVEGAEASISYLKGNNKVLETAIRKLLKPTLSGLLLRKIDYIISDNSLEIKLPQDDGESFEVLSKDIHDALSRNEPTLVLDRLHTYSTKFLRAKCTKHGLSVSDANGNHYPLHSLVGTLVKFYKANNKFESEFVEQAIKMNISTFDKYNEIRNDKSYAHDNDVLDKAEATYVVSIVTATLSLINAIE